jgi:hypothetical protein
MSTATTVTQLSDKLIKVNDYFTVHLYDNGFMVEAGGYNNKDDYVSARILCNTVQEVQALVVEACTMPRGHSY